MRSALATTLLLSLVAVACSTASSSTTATTVGMTRASAAIAPSPTGRPPSTTSEPATTTSTEPPAVTSTTAPTFDRGEPATTARIIDDVATLVGFGPRVEGSDAERAAADWIAARLIEIRGSVESMTVELPNGLRSRNLWVTIGDRSGGPWTLLGAHYDSITGSPGADDNASGTAILLELAGRLEQQPPSTGAVTIVFFGAEEVFPGLSRDDHHFGSRQWVAVRTDRGLPLPDMMVSVDMVGVGDELYAVAYAGTDVGAVDAIAAAASIVDVTVGRLERGDISDHEPFALAGVPAAMLWRPSNPAYHSAGDDTVVAGRVTAILRLVEAFAAQRHS